MEQIEVARVMEEVHRRARAAMRERAEFTDAEIFDAVEQLLERAVDHAGGDALVLGQLLSGRPELTLEPVARITSHRAVVGAIVVFVKRRVLQPLSRWLYEYSMDNFERQARINRVVFAALQELAVENARLRRELDALMQKSR